MDWEGFYKTVKEYLALHLETLTKDQAGYETNAVSSMAVEDEEYKAPFSYLEYGEDKVEMNSGNLRIENIDVYLPGKNGLDFTLTSRYNSGEPIAEKEYTLEAYDINYYDVAVKYDKYLNGMLIGSGVDRTISHVSYDEYERLKDIYEGPVEVTWESSGCVYLERHGDGSYVWQFNKFIIAGDWNDIPALFATSQGRAAPQAKRAKPSPACKPGSLM